MNGDGVHGHSEEGSKVGGDLEQGEDASEQEVIVIQDTGFTVKIQAPGAEPFDLQVRHYGGGVGFDRVMRGGAGVMGEGCYGNSFSPVFKSSGSSLRRCPHRRWCRRSTRC